MNDTIDAIVMDVDGVLTDGGFWWTAQGEELKRFCFLDVMGISLGKRAGLVFGLISGETTPFAKFFAQKMEIAEVYLGCKDKGAALKSFAESQAIPLERICYMGDDVNDLPAMGIAGLSAAPANAHPSVLERVQLRLRNRGGDGAVRELIDHILDRQGALP